MSIKITQRYEQFSIFPQTIKWFFIAGIVGILSGTASAGFLASLEWVTAWRENHIWIIALLPLAGLLIGWLYYRFGKEVEHGNNLLIDEVHSPQSVVPFRMTPLILFSTLASHLFGGSVGREGTAVQMGGSLADQLTAPFRLNNGDRRILLMAGISAGFASVFGTPLAGAVFGFEVLTIGKLRYDAIFPCFIAAIIGNKVTLAWGIHHENYGISFIPEISIKGLVLTILAGAIFGIVGMLFANTTHKIDHIFKKIISYPPLRPCIGGALVALSVWIIGTTKYIGLGTSVITDAFNGQSHTWDFVGKLAFTSLTLGSGLKGGEVTPLFFIGATLGNALSYIISLPPPLLTGLGSVAVFAGAANTPLSSILLALELFGSPIGIYASVACVVSYLFSSHAGIYRAQRIGVDKHRRWSD